MENVIKKVKIYYNNVYVIPYCCLGVAKGLRYRRATSYVQILFQCPGNCRYICNIKEVRQIGMISWGEKKAK